MMRCCSVAKRCVAARRTYGCLACMVRRGGMAAGWVPGDHRCCGTKRSTADRADASAGWMGVVAVAVRARSGGPPGIGRDACRGRAWLGIGRGGVAVFFDFWLGRGDRVGYIGGVRLSGYRDRVRSQVGAVWSDGGQENAAFPVVAAARRTRDAALHVIVVVGVRGSTGIGLTSVVLAQRAVCTRVRIAGWVWDDGSAVSACRVGVLCRCGVAVGVGCTAAARMRLCGFNRMRCTRPVRCGFACSVEWRARVR